MITAAVEVGPNVVAVVVLIMPFLMLLAQAFILYRTGKIHNEVKTINGLQLGQLADAAETRRITTDVPVVERTTAENQHVAATGPPDAAQPLDTRNRPIGGP